MDRYLVVIEPGERNYSAYLPDVPGCGATGATREEAAGNIRTAVEFHLDGLREDGEPIPESRSLAEYVTIS